MPVVELFAHHRDDGLDQSAAGTHIDAFCEDIPRLAT